jgi:hypothetical protein
MLSWWKINKKPSPALFVWAAVPVFIAFMFAMFSPITQRAYAACAAGETDVGGICYTQTRLSNNETVGTGTKTSAGNNPFNTSATYTSPSNAPVGATNCSEFPTSMSDWADNSYAKSGSWQFEGGKCYWTYLKVSADEADQGDTGASRDDKWAGALAYCDTPAAQNMSNKECTGKMKAAFDACVPADKPLTMSNSEIADCIAGKDSAFKKDKLLEAINSKSPDDSSSKEDKGKTNCSPDIGAAGWSRYRPGIDASELCPQKHEAGRREMVCGTRRYS